MNPVVMLVGISLCGLGLGRSEDLVTVKVGSTTMTVPGSHVNQKISSQARPISEAEQKRRDKLENELSILREEKRSWLQKMSRAQTGAEKATAKQKIKEISQKQTVVMRASILEEDAALLKPTTAEPSKQ
jgi:hypothetical protein